MNIDRYISYLRYEKRFSSHTIKAYKTDLKSFQTYLNNIFGLTSLVEVRPFHLRSYMAALLSDGMSASSVNRKKSSLNRYFEFAIKQNWIRENPASKLPALKNKRKLPDIIHASDLDDLFSYSYRSEDFWAIRNRIICLFFYCTGLRRSELISITCQQIQKDGMLVLGKGNKERFLPFSTKLWEHLKFYLRKRRELLLSENRKIEEVFFSVHYHKLNPKAVYNIVKTELDSTTSVRQKSPHMLRHAFATHLLDEGADISSVQKLLGHKGLGATQIYTHVSINRLKSAHANAHPRLKKD